MNKKRWLTPVVAVILVVAATAAVLTVRKSSQHSLYYGVDIINEGDDLIEMESFALYDDPNALVDVGRVFPGKTSGIAPFYQIPTQTHKIRWKNKVTGKNEEAMITITLPEGFMKKGRFINIYVNPQQSTARVAFTIRDRVSGELREIQ